jgi:DNA-binding transcriptional regulator GbsR (MarR family)
MPDRIVQKIYDTFSDIAASIGYSPIHGRIIGALLVKGKPTSLQELAKETGYSNSMISLSLDLLEILGIVKRIKKAGDRTLYIELQGDLLECLKSAFLIRVKKAIKSSLNEFAVNKNKIKDANIRNTIEILEKQIKRLEKYVNLLSKIKLP